MAEVDIRIIEAFYNEKKSLAISEEGKKWNEIEDTWKPSRASEERLDETVLKKILNLLSLLATILESSINSGWFFL